MGGHSLKAGGLFTRNSAIDGRGRGVQRPRPVPLQRRRDRQRLRGLAPRPDPRRRPTSSPPAATLDGHSNDFAVFVQDDWKASRDLTVFLGLRYEIVGAWHEKGDVLGNFRPDDGGYHIVPNAQVAAAAAARRCRRWAASAPRPRSGVVREPRQHRQEQLQPARRLRLAPGRQRQDGAARRLRPLPPDGGRAGRARPAGLQQFRYGNTRRGAPLQHGFTGGTAFVDPDDFGNQGIDPNLQSPGHLPVQPHPRARDRRRLRRARQLHRLDHAQAASWTATTNTHARQHRVLRRRPEQPGRLAARLPFPLYGFYADNVTNARLGPVPRRCRWS